MPHTPDAAVLPAARPPPATRRVLVVDDSRAQRRLLSALLRRWGHDVVECDNAHDALEVALDPAVGLILSDWMMPGMTGPEFCRRLRVARRGGYAYVILLTSKSEEGALAEGLEAGADDFLTKPVRAPDLRARLNAGARIVAMQRDALEKNRRLTEALSEIRTLYDALDSDLDEARRLQQAQLQERHRRFGAVDVSLWLKASGHIGGDMVGCFPVNDDAIGAFGLDVSGHGVAPAMIAARLAGILSAATPDQNIALTRAGDGGLSAMAPERTAAKLNRMMLKELRSDRYFTLGLGVLTLSTGRMRMVQAGHPHPMILREDGHIDIVGAGGLPIGLLSEARYAPIDLQLRPGDRMLIYSDGLTECPDPGGRPLDEVGLARLLAQQAHLRGPAFLAGLERGLAGFAGTRAFPDDASAVLIEYHGPGVEGG